MSEEKKDKPIGELLLDIHRAGGASQPPQPRRGFIDPVEVRELTFLSALACVLLTVVLLLAAIWDFADGLFVLRCFATMIVALLALLIFGWINSQFD
jgi:hypothetical protein